jgi:hypothetical protein
MREGAKPIRKWLASAYCKERNITEKTVAGVVQQFLKMYGE